ncbi:MAG TPA: transporter substrate-binding domain-containing protein [Rhodocyclaceae bacterium]|nr:transporter substrate-binding domain-containing protein [Rhodocyclaceae bacterium]
MKRAWMLLLLSLLPLPLVAETSLKVCFEGEDVRPWRYKDGSGLNFELLNRVAKRAGVVFVFETTPWRRCFADMQQGQVAGVLGASFKPERTAFGAYPGGSEPDVRRSVYTDRYVLVRRRGDAVNWDGVQFAHLQGAIAVQNGYSIGGDLKVLGVEIDDGARSAADNLHKLLNGRVPAMAALAGEMASLLAADPQLQKQLEILPKPLAEKPYYLILSHQLVKTQPELAERIWRGIESVRQSKEYRRIEAQAIAGGR